MGTLSPSFPRLGYIDNLRIALTFLVVLHHAGQAYGKGGFWYYEASERTPYLGAFFTVNASFFMGLYFFISACFTPASFDRKGPGSFLRERLLRLGVPLAFFFFGVIPILMYTYYMNFRPYGSIGFLEYYTQIYFGEGPKPPQWTGPTWPDMQFAHLWFVEHLLIYAVLYATWRQLPEATRRAPLGWLPETIRHGHLVAYALVLALATFLVRIWYPIDTWIGILGYIQSEPAHLPQYVSLFLLGLAAARKGWLKSLPASLGRTWLGLGLLLVGLSWLAMIPPLWWISPYFAGGGYSVEAAARALWEAFLCVGMCVGLLVLFRDCFFAQTPVHRSLAADTYGVYLFHVPVLVALSYMLGASLSLVASFLIVSLLGLVITTSLIEPVRRLPVLRQIL